MKNKTAQHNAGSRDFFSFCGAPTYRSRLCKNEMMAPNARRRRKNFGILGGVLYKKHEPPGGSAPAAGGNFWAFGGRCTQKSRCWDAFRNVFLAQNTPKSSKMAACGEPNPQNVSLFLNFSSKFPLKTGRQYHLLIKVGSRKS